jgi:hypothetical protein
MSYSDTTAKFVGGVEGTNVPGAISTSAIAGVGTTLAGAPVLNGALNLISTAASNTAVALPTSWPLSAPMIVANTTATGATVFPGSASQQINGATAGNSYAIAQGKAVAFFFLGNNQWVAVGA